MKAVVKTPSWYNENGTARKTIIKRKWTTIFFSVVNIIQTMLEYSYINDCKRLHISYALLRKGG